MKKLCRPKECVNAGCVAMCCMADYEFHKRYFKNNAKKCLNYKADKEKKDSKLDDLIAQKAYELDCLRDYRNIIESGDCNTCAIKHKCVAIPKAGQLVRYNCYAYVKENKDGSN